MPSKRKERAYYQSIAKQSHITFRYCVGLINIDDGRNSGAARRPNGIAIPSSGVPENREQQMKAALARYGNCLGYMSRCYGG